MCKDIKRVCSIVGAGEDKGNLHLIKSSDYLIAADGGFSHLRSVNLTPSLLVGDFDSLNCVPDCVEVKKLKIEKDETDTFICIREGIKKGCEEFKLFCCTGGRIDHTLANLQILAGITKEGKRGYLFDGNQVITAITSGEVIRFDERASGTVSLFSYSSESVGVDIFGLKYALTNSVLTNDFPLAVSNLFIGRESYISCKQGLLFVVFPTECIKNHQILKNKN